MTSSQETESAAFLHPRSPHRAQWNRELMCAVYGTAVDGNVPNGTYCAYVENTVTTDADTGQPVIEDDVRNEITVTKCHGDKEFCYTLWYIDPHDEKRYTIFMQGY